MLLGWILLGLSVVSCLLGLTGIRTPAGTRFAASGRDGAFATPCPPDGTVSVNFAEVWELTHLPGVGETTAQAILDERNRNGLFHYPEDLLAVKGIGEEKLAKMRPLLDMTAE